MEVPTASPASEENSVVVARTGPLETPDNWWTARSWRIRVESLPGEGTRRPEDFPKTEGTHRSLRKKDPGEEKSKPVDGSSERSRRD